MGPIENILLEAHERGARFWLEGGELRYRMPKDALTPQQLSDLSAHKAEIARLLGRDMKRAPNLIAQPRDHSLPLSYSQERLWFLEQLGLLGAAYHIRIAYRLAGDMNVDALSRSFRCLVQRHESLRTRFGMSGGEGVQIIEGADAFELLQVDGGHFEAEGKEERLRQWIQQQTQRPFDLGQGPLFRVALLRLSAQEHVLLIMMHHIVSDGWSTGVLIGELGELYAAEVQGRTANLPALTLQYADYAIWQRQWLQGERLEQQLKYWQESLQGAPQILELPTDRPRPAVASFKGATESLELPPLLATQLHALCGREGVTLYMLMLASFVVLLSRWSGQTDIVVGSPIAGRTRRELQPLIGFFVNTLLLRGQVSDNPSFRELLRRMRQTTLQAFAHQDLPFERLVAQLQPVRALSHQPLFQAMLMVENTARGALSLPELQVSELHGGWATSQLDLTLSVQGGGAGTLRYAIQYATDLFDRSTITRMLRHVRVLLQSIVSNPDGRVAELPMLTPEERHQLLVEWDTASVSYRPRQCLHELIEQQVCRSPDAVALIHETQHLTYSQLDSRADRLARRLQQLGVEPNTLVGVCAERSLDLVISLLGVLKAGGAYLPLAPDYPAERLRYMLQDAKPKVLLTEERLLASLPVSSDLTVLCLDRVDTELDPPEQASLLKWRVQPQDLAYCIYTSGSTGRPKGVLVTHASIVNHMEWMRTQFVFGPADRVLQKTPFSFDASVWEFWLPLLTGGQCVLAPQGIEKDPVALAAKIREQNVTVLQTVPSLLRALLRHSENRDALKQLRNMFCGGEVLPADLADMWLSNCGGELWNLYGPTEATIDATAHRVLQPIGADVPIGRPIANTRIRILDTNQQLVPVGVKGEIYIGGAGVALGYHQRPDLTEERFVPDAYSEQSGQRLYRTGDLARYRPDGCIEYLGRADHQIKLRGYRIELGEIEARLREHSAISDAVVLLRQNNPEDVQLVGYVVSRDEAIDSDVLRRHLRASLPEYMVPAVFVVLDSLPLMANGKIDRAALPEPNRSAGDEGSSDCETATEMALANIWAEAMGLQKVKPGDNFFELGGHSVLAMKIVFDIEQRLGVSVPVLDLFEAPTVRSLAIRVDQLNDDLRSQIEQMSDDQVAAALQALQQPH